MKPIFTAVTRSAALAVAMSALCLAGNAVAEQNTNPNGVPDTVSDNPHLRGSTSAPRTQPAASLNAKDKDFISKAAAGGMMEVQMGEMASKMGKSPEVKKIGQMMVSDHTRANNELKAIAEKKGLSIGKPQKGPPSMGADFDRQYLAQMVSDHQQDIALFQGEAKNGTDPEIKGFAAKTLPVIQRHLAMVKQAMGKSSKKS